MLFFELLFPSFRALFHALFTFPNEYRMLMKARRGFRGGAAGGGTNCKRGFRGCSGVLSAVLVLGVGCPGVQPCAPLSRQRAGTRARVHTMSQPPSLTGRFARASFITLALPPFCTAGATVGHVPPVSLLPGPDCR